MKRLILLLFLIVSGCCGTKMLRIEDKDRYIVPSPVEDSLDWYWADDINPSPSDPGIVDSLRHVIEAIKREGRDTVIHIKVTPIERKVYVKVKPDTVKFTYRDTVNIIQEKVVKNSIFSQIGIVLVGIIVGALISFPIVTFIMKR